MHELGSRARRQPAPPQVIYEALTQPRRPEGRQWLQLLDDEQDPSILATTADSVVVWSSLWPQRPALRIRFDLSVAGSYDTLLRWAIESPEPLDDASALGHMRKRMNVLINESLRTGFGQ